MNLKRFGIQVMAIGSLFWCAAAVEARAESQKDGRPSIVTPEPLPLPMPPELPPELIPPPTPPTGTAARSGKAIGSAEMQANGTIRLHLWPPADSTSDPQERIGYGEIEIDNADPVYMRMLNHLGGLRPGEVKAVPPWRADERWHCMVDPDRGPCPLEHLLQ